MVGESSAVHVQTYQSEVRVGDSYSEAFDVGIHQGSVLSPLLFIIVMEALSMSPALAYPWNCYVLMISLS